jgi:hypothetical protein
MTLQERGHPLKDHSKDMVVPEMFPGSFFPGIEQVVTDLLSW